MRFVVFVERFQGAESMVQCIAWEADSYPSKKVWNM
jgi:hypothetical protein